MQCDNSNIRLGVLALQGGFQKHIAMLQRIGCSVTAVKESADLTDLHGLLIPGGESTTIGMLMERFGVLLPLRAAISTGFPVFGTCAGAILLADRVENSSQITIGGLPVTVRRNAYGRQIESFETDLQIRTIAEQYPQRGVFIRAPQIIAYDDTVTVLSTYENSPVVVRHGNLLAATFHPELTNDDRLHTYFALQIAANWAQSHTPRTNIR